MLRFRPLLRVASSSLVRPCSSVRSYRMASAASELLAKSSASRSNNPMTKSVSKRLFSENKATGSVFNVHSQEEFNKLVLKSNVPVIVDFHADWCGPCQTLGPRLESLVSSKNGRVLLAKVDIDSCAELAIDHGVQVVPTVVAFKNGKSAEKFVGAQDDRVINGFIDRLIGK